MTNHTPTFTSSSASASFTENANTTGSGALHLLSGTMTFKDSDRTDTHTTSAALKSAVLSGGSGIPAASLAHFNGAMSSQILTDSNGSGKLKWSFSDADSDFDFLAKNQTLVLTYEITVSDNHGGSVKQTVKVTITGTDDKPIIDVGVDAVVTEQADHTLSFAPDTAHVAVHFTDPDLSNTGHTASVIGVSASGNTDGLLPGFLGQAELMAFYHVDNVVKAAGSSNGTINTTFSAPDLAFDYLAAGETLNIDYTVRIDDHAGGVSTQIVTITVVGTNDKPIYLSGPESVHLTENDHVSPAGNLTAHGDLLFTDIDLSDTHTVSTTVSATRSGGGAIPISDADLIAALSTSLEDSDGHLLGEVDWNFALPNNSASFLSAGETLTLTYTIAVTDPAGGSDTQTVTITIAGVEDQLIVNPATGTLLDTAAQDTGNIVANGDLILDPNDSGGDLSNLTVTEVNGMPVMGSIDVAGAYGTLTVFSGGQYFYTANSALDPLQVGDSATEIFDFTVNDGLGHNVPTTLTLNIVGADDAPQITAAQALGTMTEDAGPTSVVNGSFESGDFTGWVAGAGASIDFLGIGGSLGNYGVRLHGGTISQDVATTPGQHYTLSFFFAADPEATSDSFSVFWDGVQVFGITDQFSGFTRYTVDVVGDATQATTNLLIAGSSDASGVFVDQISVESTAGQPTESADGSVSFSDVETQDTHTASFVPQGMDYVGTFTLDPVSETSGSGSVGWHFTVDNSDIQFLSQGQALTQTYTVLVTDDHGVSTAQDVTVTINGANDAPTAVGQTIVTDIDPNTLVIVPGWALAHNGTDPDSADTLSLAGVDTSSGGSAFALGGNAFFFEDDTLGGSFTYDVTDGIAVSAATATAAVVNVGAGATALVGTSGNDILIATNGSETLSGGGGNDILIGNAGTHTMTGGTGDDIFAFQQPTDGPNTITDFDNTTAHDQIAISAASFGAGLAAGMDTSFVFESGSDDQFSGVGPVFHYDTANQTLYFSADGTTASAVALAQLQPGVDLHAHDLLIV